MSLLIFSRVVMYSGAFILLLPFFGLPSSWDKLIISTTATALLVAGFYVSIGARAINRRKAAAASAYRRKRVKSENIINESLLENAPQ